VGGGGGVCGGWGGGGGVGGGGGGGVVGGWGGGVGGNIYGGFKLSAEENDAITFKKSCLEEWRLKEVDARKRNLGLFIPLSRLRLKARKIIISPALSSKQR